MSVEAQIHGFLDVPPDECNVLTCALNQELGELAKAYGAAKVPYRHVRVGEDLHRGDR